jgi:hypothetical protein
MILRISPWIFTEKTLKRKTKIAIESTLTNRHGRRRSGRRRPWAAAERCAEAWGRCRARHARPRVRSVVAPVTGGEWVAGAADSGGSGGGAEARQAWTAGQRSSASAAPAGGAGEGAEEEEEEGRAERKGERSRSGKSLDGGMSGGKGG